MTVPERYVELGLRLGRHVEGLVDSYYGPPEIADRVNAEPLPEPAALVQDAESLLADADRWLRAQIVGLGTVAEKLAGVNIPYADEVERCYGVRPRRTPDSVFEQAHAELDRVLPGDGPLAQRYQAWREGDPVPRERLEEVFAALSADLRERTRNLVGLPEGEDAEIDFVTGEPWSAYNYYLGGLRSRVAVNLDVPMVTNYLVELMAHELYPGHHTEHAWKEQLLVREGGVIEESILMIGAPQSLIAEGIAKLAPKMATGDEDVYAAEHLAAFGIDYDAESNGAIRRAAGPLERVGGNTAFLLYEDGVPEAEARAYHQRWGLTSDRRADIAMSFITDPIWRSYLTTYTDGYAVCSAWVDGDPARYRRLLTEQLTPDDLVDGVSSGR